MKLSTGKVAFPIDFDNGDKAVIYFNPSDKMLQERIRNFQSSIEARAKGLDLDKHKEEFENLGDIAEYFENPEKMLELSAEELGCLQEKMATIGAVEDEYNKAMMEEIDVVFDSQISEAVFRYCKPFDMVVLEDENGNPYRELYIMHFIKCLMAEIKKNSQENYSAMNKHLEKYRK